VERAGQLGYRRWLDHVSTAGGCTRPVRLTGALHTIDTTTGRIIATRDTGLMPDSVIYVPCGDRRASVCAWCAETYRADTYQLIRAGLVGGKGVPDSVASHPAVFATLTAPSFGPVHVRVVNSRNGKVRPCHLRRHPQIGPDGRPVLCTARHREDSRALGKPINPGAYDYAGHVVWNAFAGELWRRTTITLSRAVRHLGKQHGFTLRVSYGKVAEYQARGVVHFHALLRLDLVDPADPDVVLPPPATITAADLGELFARAVASTRYTTPVYPLTSTAWTLTWGTQLDIRPVASLAAGEITSEAVAAYLAKYATKSTEATGHLSTRITVDTIDHHADPDTHTGRLIAHAWTLGTPPADLLDPAERDRFQETFGRLRRWAHMLGFGGHFATKSRRYSTTHKQLRADRRTWQRAQDRLRRPPTAVRPDDLDTEETTLVVGTLTFAGMGWQTPADQLLATSAAARAREYRRALKQERQAA
jgi:hypothetical protein